VTPLPEVPADELRQVMERLHGGRAYLREAVHLVEHFRGQVAWEGTVHVFDLEAHPLATVCYAWTSAVGEGDQRRFYAVLGAPPINSAAGAVRASIIADKKAGRLP
jgi:hypothetical protein